MNALPNLFDDETRRLMSDLYGFRPKPTRAEYLAQLNKWCEEAGAIHTPAEIERIAAEQARLVDAMGNK
jgi:hypothetical protein